ncbi:MAG: hypothetical protein PHU21_02855 [Elusimicrobia bacterium]|nr:hypothetical protein [Elusimicrobiota bacterium]
MKAVITALIVATLAIPALAAPKAKTEANDPQARRDREFCARLGGRYKVKKGKPYCGFGGALECTIPDLMAHTCRIPAPAKLEQCKSTADCAPDACCHPKGCVASANPGLYSYLLCSNLACSGVCMPGTLDCGQASCQCIEGKCSALPTVTSPR